MSKQGPEVVSQRSAVGIEPVSELSQTPRSSGHIASAGSVRGANRKAKATLSFPPLTPRKPQPLHPQLVRVWTRPPTGAGQRRLDPVFVCFSNEQGVGLGPGPLTAAYVRNAFGRATACGARSRLSPQLWPDSPKIQVRRFAGNSSSTATPSTLARNRSSQSGSPTLGVEVFGREPLVSSPSGCAVCAPAGRRRSRVYSLGLTVSQPALNIVPVWEWLPLERFCVVPAFPRGTGGGVPVGKPLH